MPLIKENLSKRVLSIAPDYKNLRGGIGSVINVYSSLFERFEFIATYKYHKNHFVNLFVYLKQVFNLVWKLTFSRSIKIVHIHGAHRGSFYRKYVIFLIAKGIFGKKIVHHNHSGCFDTYFAESSPFMKKRITHFINKSDVIICLSGFWKEFFEKNFKPKRLYIVNNVIFPPDPAISEGTVPKDGKINFLFLGRITQQKGIYDLIEVLHRERQFYKDKVMLRIGGNDEVEQLNALISQYELGSFVEFVGWVEMAKKKELLAQSNVYVLPSYYEGLPISILEAMSYGLAIVSTPVGGIPEVVEEGVNGLLVQPGDVPALDAAMRSFVLDPSRTTRLGKASLQKISPYYPQQAVTQLQEIYESLLIK